MRAPHNAWYGQAKWRKRARAQLLKFPLCQFCLDKGKVTAATIVDHVEPHRGDEFNFYNGAVQSLCKFHHDTTKRQKEILGYVRDIGEDGWPLDPDHPVYNPKVKRVQP